MWIAECVVSVDHGGQKVAVTAPSFTAENPSEALAGMLAIAVEFIEVQSGLWLLDCYTPDIRAIEVRKWDCLSN